MPPVLPGWPERCPVQVLGGAALILSILSAPEPDSWAQGIGGTSLAGSWVLVCCLDRPEHPEKQGEKVLTQPAPLPLSYFMCLEGSQRSSRMEQGLCHGDASAGLQQIPRH